MPFDSYIKPQLPFRLICPQWSCMPFDSYIKPQLACTTTVSMIGCMPFDSYIKPQRKKHSSYWRKVVCLLIPTSNHNKHQVQHLPHLLYAFWFLHQTTTVGTYLSRYRVLYAFWFLHQTTTQNHSCASARRCMPFDSYIKPQPLPSWAQTNWVVCLLIPTSNHNSYINIMLLNRVVCLLIPTSNHNLYVTLNFRLIVVCLLIPTSNHNWIFLLLYQYKVVCLLIPTSNHNWREGAHAPEGLYAFWFLHQTTTAFM